MLANATRYRDLEAYQAGLVLLVGNFTFNGTGEPDGAEGKPFRTSGLDLDRTGVGAYTLTIPGNGAIDILAYSIHIEDPTDKLLVGRITRTDSARTIAFEILDIETGATATDPTDNTARLIVTVWVKSRPI